MIAAGVIIGATGLWELWKFKHDPNTSGSNAPQSSRQDVSGSNTLATAVGSIRDIGAGATVMIGGEIQKPSSPPVRPKVSVRPNIKYSGPRNTVLFLGQSDHAGLKEPTNSEQREAALSAVVLKFENEPWEDGSGADASGLIARVIYRLSSTETRRVDFGVWIEGWIRTHYIKFEETQELFLLSRSAEKDKSIVYWAFEDKRTRSTSFHDPWSWFRLEEFPGVISAEVTITDQKSQARYVFDFTVEDNDGTFLVSLKP